MRRFSDQLGNKFTFTGVNAVYAVFKSLRTTDINKSDLLYFTGFVFSTAS